MNSTQTQASIVSSFNYFTTLNNCVILFLPYSNTDFLAGNMFYSPIINHNEITLTYILQQAFILTVCGGILGLCLGISALSIIECLYFLTLRLYWSINQWKPKKAIEPIEPRRINRMFVDMPKY